MKSTFYTEDHEAYRDSVREFLARTVGWHEVASAGRRNTHAALPIEPVSPHDCLGDYCSDGFDSPVCGVSPPASTHVSVIFQNKAQCGATLSPSHVQDHLEVIRFTCGAGDTSGDDWWLRFAICCVSAGTYYDSTKSF